MKATPRLFLATALLMLSLLSTSVIRAQAFTNGQSASIVLGQKDFVSRDLGGSRTGINDNGGMTFDSGGNLWVADLFNNRVLEFNPPFSNGMDASLVIGQPDFTTYSPTTSQAGLNVPRGVAFDHAGNLWVADGNNNRVLQFKPPFSTGMPASLVIGQKNFTTALPGGSRGVAGGPDELLRPGGVAFDNSGNLWVLDTGNNRILEFTSTVVPEFPTASLAIIALVSLAIVPLVLRRFPMRRAGQRTESIARSRRSGVEDCCPLAGRSLGFHYPSEL